MRRILADAQAKFRVMVEENAATGARLDGELERARGECATLRGELRDVRGALPIVLNNNNAGNGSSNSNNNSGTATGVSGGTTANPGQEVETQQQAQQEDAKRLSASSSPIEKRSSASDKSASPIDKRTSPVDRKDRTSPIDRRGSPVERRNGSPCRSPSEKARRPCAPALEKTRLGGSGGSVDSRSGSASPDRGSTNRSGFLHRASSDRSSVERLRISTNRDSLRSSKEMNDHDQKDADKDLVDGDARGDEDNEPPGPAPGSRPSSPANSLGIGDPVVASRLSNIHGGGGHAELASARRLRLENERLVAEVARLRRLLLSGAARGEVGAEDAAMEEEARFVALEMELQHAKEALQALKADRKRLKAEKFDLLNQMKALYGTLEDKERELRDFIRNYEQRMRENEATLGRLQQQGAGMPSEERERERERERWSLLRAARDEADRSLSLAASLADKEAALSHAHATIKELQRQLGERGGGGGICLSDQESLVSFPRGSVNGAATPGAAAAAAAAAAATATATTTVATTTISTTSSTTAAATCRVASLPRRKRKKRRRQRVVASNDDVPGVAVVVASRGATTSSGNAAVVEDNTAVIVATATTTDVSAAAADAVVVLEPDADAVADADADADANAPTAETNHPAAAAAGQRVDKLRSRLLGEQQTAAAAGGAEAHQQLRVGGSGSRAAASSVGTAGVTLLNRRAGKRSPRRCNAGGRRSAMTMDLQRLINEVHARPAIWDQKNVNYHNRDVILKMWREIARSCEVSTDVAKSKWKHLRDNFRNELKKTYRGKCDGIGGTEHDSKWVWFKSLFFLRDQMNSRVIGCALSQNCVGVGMRSSPDGTQIEPQIDILEGHEETQFDDLDGDSCQSLLSNDDGLHQVMPPPKMNKIIGRKRALMDAIENDYGVEVDRKRYESLQKRLAIGPEDEDDTYHFLMSVRNPLRSLPLDRQMFIRLKIQELVYNEINSQNQQHQQQQHNANRGVYDASSQGQDVKPPRAGNSGNGVVGGDVVNDMSHPASLLQNCTPEGSGDDAFFG